jgi:hypothetical protein
MGILSSILKSVNMNDCLRNYYWFLDSNNLTIAESLSMAYTYPLRTSGMITGAVAADPEMIKVMFYH